MATDHQNAEATEEDVVLCTKGIRMAYGSPSEVEVASASLREATRQTNLAIQRAVALANVLKSRGAPEKEIVDKAIGLAAVPLQALLPALIEHDLSSRIADGRSLREAVRDLRALLDERWDQAREAAFSPESR